MPEELIRKFAIFETIYQFISFFSSIFVLQTVKLGTDRMYTLHAQEVQTESIINWCGPLKYSFNRCVFWVLMIA